MIILDERLAQLEAAGTPSRVVDVAAGFMVMDAGAARPGAPTVGFGW